MAYSRLPEPGKVVNGIEIGPCVGGCEHKDCNATRNQAETECSICGERIGYETSFQRDREGNLVHYLCNIEKVENEK